VSIEDSSTLPTPIDSGAGRVTAFDQLPGILERPRRIADTAGHASRKTRILRTKKRSIALPRSVRKQAGVARSESKHILHLMRKFHISNEEILRASPALRRNLTQRLLLQEKILIPLIAINSLLYSIPPLLLWSVLDTNPKVVNSLTLITTFVVCVIVFRFYRNDDTKRNLKYSTSRLASFLPRLWWMLLLLFLPVLLWLNSDDISRANRREFIFAGTETILAVAYLSLVFKTQELILRWRAPDLVLVRALADAFETVAEGGPAVWRSIAAREKAAAYVSEAANVIEGPIARKFVRSAGDAGAGARLLAAGAALRQKVAWLATPQPDTRDFLARVLAKELLIAATGDLDRLECAEITGSLRAGRLTRFVAIVSRAVLIFGPVFLVIGKLTGWPPLDDANTATVIQFAVVCVSFGLVSGIGSNDYKEKLGSVLSMGGTLFGWKR
jgi:hypothetical protein